MTVLSLGGDEHSKRRDSIVLAFQDAKLTVLEYDDSTHGLRTRYDDILVTIFSICLEKVELYVEVLFSYLDRHAKQLIMPTLYLSQVWQTRLKNKLSLQMLIFLSFLSPSLIGYFIS